jgi:hypothetical protein
MSIEKALLVEGALAGRLYANEQDHFHDEAVPLSNEPAPLNFSRGNGSYRSCWSFNSPFQGTHA